MTQRVAEFALAIGSFAIGTGEFAAMGFLPSVADGWQVSVPQAGHIISAYALGVVVGAPLIAVLGARLPRRSLLLILMAMFALANLASALAPSFGALLGFRFLSGLPHGAYFGVASLVAADMAGPGGRARAIGRVMLGITIATLVGTPAATWAGQVLGWRMAFGAVGLLGALSVALVFACVAHDPPHEDASPLRELGALRKPQVWLTLGIAAIGFGGLFSVFSYITPTLINDAQLPPASVPFALCLFGAGMITGNIIGPKFADKALLPTIFWSLLWNIGVLTLFYFGARHQISALLFIFLVGTNFVTVPALQTRLMDVGQEAQTLSAALNHSAFNIANALGAWAGGAAIDAGFGWSSTGLVGSALGVMGFGIFLISVYAERRSLIAQVSPA
ncbi:MFS transporter [Aestuariivirga litoralis]|uniref:MFS transporter n=1 Tax=Aestuariivirga litoralis TaxID=2650924 RepID=UPI0018C7369F|nr:MFS transporter [Aestuariivirga litoralis]